MRRICRTAATPTLPPDLAQGFGILKVVLEASLFDSKTPEPAQDFPGSSQPKSLGALVDLRDDFHSVLQRLRERVGLGGVKVVRGDLCASFSSSAVVTNMLFLIKFVLSDLGICVFHLGSLQ